MEVKDKLALVTGGAKRVGKAIVEALCEIGARPLIHCHQSYEEAKTLVQQTGGEVLRADLSRPEGAHQLIQQVLQVQGELAVWVNNAAAFDRVGFLDSDDRLWHRTIQLVLLSPQTCARRVAHRMVEGGVIINVLDLAAHQPWRGYAHYCVSKAALSMLTRTLAVELAPRLRVNSITPGIVLPPETLPRASRERLINRIPLGRQGNPSDVGQAVCFLVQSDYLTGIDIPVDGGMTVRSI